MRQNQFLQKDKKKVIAEHRAAMACISRSEHYLTLGDFKAAERFAIDYLKSVHELMKLEQRKWSNDRLMEVVKELSNKGVLIEVIPVRRETIG